MALIACDLDGTLFLGEGKADFDDPTSVRRFTGPDRRALAQARRLAKTHRFAYVTGRSEKLRAVTTVQIRTVAPFPAGPLYMRPRGPFPGYAKMARWKADRLVELAADIYIGDQGVDQEAARVAGCMFESAEDFRQYGIVHERVRGERGRLSHMPIGDDEEALKAVLA